MPTFRYQPLATNGSYTGPMVIDAPDRAAAVRLLRERGVTPTKLEQVGGLAGISGIGAVLSNGGNNGSNGTLTAAPSGSPQTQVSMASYFNRAAMVRRGAMSRAEMASFVRELATAIQAGLPLVQALKTIARQIKSASPKAMLDHLIHEVEHGRSLSDAAASWGKPFSDLGINLIRAGEISGRLDEVLGQAANLLDRDLKMRRTMLSGLMYPMILAILIVIAITVIVTVIVPRILAPLAGKITKAQLPLPTRIVSGIAQFAGEYWYLILGAVALIVVAVWSMWTKPSSRLSIDRGLLKSPLLGRVLRDVAVARFTRTLGTLVSAGLPALTALRITRGTLGNKAMEGVIGDVCDQVAAGKTISDPMEQSGYFPPLLTQIIGLGERSGRLPQMLDQAASVFEERTEQSIKIFTTAFPPIMVVFAALLVALVMAAVLLPLLQMQDYIG